MDSGLVLRTPRNDGYTRSSVFDVTGGRAVAAASFVWLDIQPDAIIHGR